MSSPIRALDELLASLRVERRPGHFVVVSVADPTDVDHDDVDALIRETEGWTAVRRLPDHEHGAPPLAAAEGFVAAWLTLTVHSSLTAVGLTAAVATALAEIGVPANVLAARHHDHLLVPEDMVDVAVAAIESLSR